MLKINQGFTFKTSTTPILDLYVDADFAGLWSYEHDQDPVCVRSRTSYVMTLGGCPIHWCSMLQTEIALFTMEAEYIALPQAMQEFIPMRRKFDELCNYFKLHHEDVHQVKSTIFGENIECISCATAPKMSLCTRLIAIKYHFVRTFFLQIATSNILSSLKRLTQSFNLQTFSPRD